MVGWFVEKKKVGLHHQKPRQMRAHDPAAAERARRSIEICLAKSKSCENAFRLWFKLPAAVLVENMERIIIGTVICLACHAVARRRLVLFDDFLRMNKL